MCILGFQRKVSVLRSLRYCCFALGFVFATLAFPASVYSAVETSHEKVTLQLRWFHQFQFAGYYAAKAKGYYEEAGLDVTIVERDLKTTPIDAVLEGKADFGVTNSEILVHRLAGKPLVALAAVFQHSPLVFVVPEAKGISTPHDLIGKRVLMSTKSMDVELRGMLQKERIGLDQLDIVDRFSKTEDYFDPSMDAIAAYITNQPFFLQDRGVSYSIISPTTYGIDFYGDCLFTTEEEVATHPARVRAFRDASLKGWAYAMANPEEIIDLLTTEYGTKKSREHLQYEAEAIRKIMLPDLVEIGHMNPGRWKHIAKVFTDLGIARPGASLEGFIYDPELIAQNIELQYFLIAMASVASILAMGFFFLAIFNRRLKNKVQQRTEALTIKAAELEKANQRLTELDRVKSALLSSVSHELRTPLTAVLGFVKLIGKEFEKTFAPLASGNGELEAKRVRINKNLQVISVEGERLTRLISDVLDLSKIESGKVVWRDQDIDLGELARNSAAIVQEQFAQNPDTHLQVRIPDGLPTLHADPDRIIQVLINLLSNAAKFTPEGDVILEVTANEKDVQFTVSDTGVGVAEEDIERVFNMFHQVRRDDTIKLDKQGAGLGLAISKHIVEHYSGSISLHSRIGKGSRFTVTLPIIDRTA